MAARMRNPRSSFLSTTCLMPLLVFLASNFPLASSSSSHPYHLSKGCSLSVDNTDNILRSPNGVFSAGFHQVGRNAYAFAVWFSNQSCNGDCVVWMANRDEPVNGKHSKLILSEQGNLLLTDADQKVVWSTDVAPSPSAPSVRLQLLDTGNLRLHQSAPNPRNNDIIILWQSFDYPTDTLLPDQKFTRYTTLVSSRARGNVSPGYYKLYFDNDNILRLLYNGPEISSVYWPRPDLLPCENGRSTFNSSRVALLNSLGNFTSSDDWNFKASDYGGENIWRRLTLDLDGNVRLYSLQGNGKWAVSWQAINTPCDVHGICGPNAVCQYNAKSGRSCSCAPGYERKNLSDWSEGCKAKFKPFCKLPGAEPSDFLHVPDRDFYGYDEGIHRNFTLSQCKRKCLELCSCKGFQYRFNTSQCEIKASLWHGRFSLESQESTYFRLPKSMLSLYQSQPAEPSTLNCPRNLRDVELHRVSLRSHENKLLMKILLIVAGMIAGMEALGILLVRCFITVTRQRKGEDIAEGYQLASMGFRRFTYAELKKATQNFRQEIGRGAAGIVYLATLPGGQVAAVKRLYEARLHGEDEFLAEVSMIGKLNHMNLIEMWGYCAEGKHRLLVYEYMEHGSLAENLSNGTLDWEKRFDVAIGAARGLAYLHGECLEWVLHCDVKPQNILLDSNYRPKVADLGLSKLRNRGDRSNSSFSKIRGTRGYMAPEWVYNSSITSKVDVYSYGIVLLEMITGRSPTESPGPTSWVRGKVNGDVPMATWIEGIVDHSVGGEYDVKKVEVLVAVALQCVAEDKDERPTMRQAVEMLERHGNEAEIIN